MARAKLQLPTKEEILTTWDNCFVINRMQLPKESGVYVLATGNLFLYIGCSSNIKNRLSKLANHPIRELVMLDSIPKGFISQYVATELNLRAYWRLFKLGRERHEFEWAMIKHFKPVVNSSQILWTLGLRKTK